LLLFRHGGKEKKQILHQNCFNLAHYNKHIITLLHAQHIN